MGSSTSRFQFRFATDLAAWDLEKTTRALGKFLKLREKRQETGHLYATTVNRREFFSIFQDTTGALEGVFVDLPVGLFRCLDRSRKGSVRAIEALFLLYLYGGGELEPRLENLYRIVNTAREVGGVGRYNLEGAIRVTVDAHFSIGVATRVPEDSELEQVVEHAFRSMGLGDAAGMPLESFQSWVPSTDAMVHVLARFALRRERFDHVLRSKGGLEMLQDAVRSIVPSLGEGEEKEEEVVAVKSKFGRGRNMPARSAETERKFREAQRRRAIDRATSRDEVEHVVEHTSLSAAQVIRVKDTFAKYADRSGELGRKHFRLVMADAMPALALDGSADRLFEAFDADKNGRVNFREFCSGLTIVMDGPLEEKVDLLFSIYDADGDGEINIHEMLRFVKNGSERVFASAERALARLSRMETVHENCLTARELGELAIATPSLARAIANEIQGSNGELEKDAEKAAVAPKTPGSESTTSSSPTTHPLPKKKKTSSDDDDDFDAQEIDMRPASEIHTVTEVSKALIQTIRIIGQLRKEAKGEKGTYRPSFSRLWRMTCGPTYSDAEHLRTPNARTSADSRRYAWLGNPLFKLGFQGPASERAERLRRLLSALEDIFQVRLNPPTRRRISSMGSDGGDLQSPGEDAPPTEPPTPSVPPIAMRSRSVVTWAEAEHEEGEEEADPSPELLQQQGRARELTDRLIDLLLIRWPEPARGIVGDDDWSAEVGGSGELAGLGAPSAIVLRGARTLLDALARAVCNSPIEAALTFFRGMDVEGTGLITKKELSKALLSLCTRTDAGLQAASRLIIALDVDGDGTISRMEFQDAIARKPRLYECFARLLEPQGLSDRQLSRLRRRAMQAAYGEPSAVLYSILGDTNVGVVMQEEEDSKSSAAKRGLQSDVDEVLGLGETPRAFPSSSAQSVPMVNPSAPVSSPRDDLTTPTPSAKTPRSTKSTRSRPGGVAFGNIAGSGDNTKRSKRSHRMAVSRVINPVHHRIRRHEGMTALKSIDESLSHSRAKLSQTLEALHKAEASAKSHDRASELARRRAQSLDNKRKRKKQQ